MNLFISVYRSEECVSHLMDGRDLFQLDDVSLLTIRQEELSPML